MSEVTTFVQNINPSNYVKHDVFIFSITALTGDTVNLINVPAYTVIDDIALTVVGSVANSTSAVGDGNVAGRFISATASATSVFLRANVPNTVSSGEIVNGIGYRYTTADTIDLTLGGSSADATDRTYVLHVWYHTDWTA